MSMNNTKFICIIMIFTLMIILNGVSSAYSQVIFKDYEKLKRTQEFKLFIAGVAEGVSLSNMVLEKQGTKKIFCQPTNATMSADNILNILQKEIDENAKLFKSDTLLGLILIRGLVKTYPCK
jgi:hypothetical protein